MTDSDDTSSSVSSVANVNQAHEYYEESGHQILDLRKQKNPTPISSISFVNETSRAIDPVKKLNDDLNRQFRPDLVCYVLNRFLFSHYYFLNQHLIRI